MTAADSLSARADRRLPALDAARGVLAMVVMCSHVGVGFGWQGMDLAALVCVLLFFTMSGFVLARAYDGRPLTFMARRMVRLWPLYAVCVLAGHLAYRTLPHPGEFCFAWGPNFYLWVDPPAWSLRYEVWATPAFPLLFVLARTRVWLCWALVAAAILATGLVDFRFMFAAAMIAGVALWPLRPNLRVRTGRSVLWLGKISYSLYLTHWIVLTAARQVGGPWAALACAPLAVCVAWVAWWGVERPSVLLSRRVDLQRRVFYSEEKKQKTFDCAVADSPGAFADE